ncbi:MAG TPA: helix-turn-helix transcriptional regulator [Candidatus Enterenecus stercoripullorum]|nr:helix-turn-helix transcriptional regulator [Candidatus Enterenecus stercoripullorum]
MEFSQRLYALRRKAGLSQEELANLVGVTRQAVQKWESGGSLR